MPRFFATWRRLRYRLRLAYAVATDKIDRSTGLDLIYVAERATGIYAIEHITVEAMMETIVDRFGENPRFEALAEEAIQRVASKWTSNGDLTGAAYDWAENIFAEYAAAEKLVLHDAYA